MSRTYRRPQSLGWVNGRKDWEGKKRHFDICVSYGWGCYIYEETWEEFLRDLHKDGTWTYSTPSEWNRQYHTKPRRAKTRIQIQKIYRLIDYEDCPEFPIDKKPHIYYW